MSLTSELEDRKSPVTLFFADTFPDVASVQRAWRERMADAQTIAPGGPRARPWSTIAMALDYRIRYYFGVTPGTEFVAAFGTPLLAEVGVMVLGNTAFFALSAVREGGWSKKGRSYWALKDGTTISSESTARAGLGSSVYGVTGDITPGDPPTDSRWTQALGSFFEGLDSLAHTLRPVGRRLSPDRESELLRHCYVLALLEELARTGGRVKTHPLVGLTPRPTAKSMLGLADPWLDDLRQLSRTAERTLRPFFGKPVALNPKFAGSSDIGGADADLIFGRCLFELKTTKSLSLRREWLYQLLGYVFLDYADEFDLAEVGIYMSRQGELVLWKLGELIPALREGRNLQLSTLRQRFRKAVREARMLRRNPMLD